MYIYTRCWACDGQTSYPPASVFKYVHTQFHLRSHLASSDFVYIVKKLHPHIRQGAMCQTYVHRYACAHVTESTKMCSQAVRDTNPERNPISPANCPNRKGKKVTEHSSPCGGSDCILSRKGGVWTCCSCHKTPNRRNRCQGCNKTICRSCTAVKE